MLQNLPSWSRDILLLYMFHLFYLLFYLNDHLLMFSTKQNTSLSFSHRCLSDEALVWASTAHWTAHGLSGRTQSQRWKRYLFGCVLVHVWIPKWQLLESDWGKYRVSLCFGPNFWRCFEHEYIPNGMPGVLWQWNKILQEYHKIFRYICILHNSQDIVWNNLSNSGSSSNETEKISCNHLPKFLASWWTHFFATCFQVAGPPLEADWQVGMWWLNCIHVVFFLGLDLVSWLELYYSFLFCLCYLMLPAPSR